jgi:hypothetical protein
MSLIWIKKNESDAVEISLQVQLELRSSYLPVRIETHVFATSEFGVRRAETALSSGCKPHPAAAPAGSDRSSHGGNEVAEAFD